MLSITNIPTNLYSTAIYAPGNWSNMDRVRVLDGSSAADTWSNAMSAAPSGHFLTANNFGFVSGTILGIECTITRRSTTGTIIDGTLQLVTHNTASGPAVPPGDLVGNNKANLSRVWGTSLETFTYGSSNDTWGATLSGSDIIASGFGIRFVPYSSGADASPAVEVDYLALTIYYSGLSVNNSFTCFISGSGTGTINSSVDLFLNSDYLTSGQIPLYLGYSPTRCGDVLVPSGDRPETMPIFWRNSLDTRQNMWSYIDESPLSSFDDSDYIQAVQSGINTTPFSGLIIGDQFMGNTSGIQVIDLRMLPDTTIDSPNYNTPYYFHRYGDDEYVIDGHPYIAEGNGIVVGFLDGIGIDVDPISNRFYYGYPFTSGTGNDKQWGWRINQGEYTFSENGLSFNTSILTQQFMGYVPIGIDTYVKWPAAISVHPASGIAFFRLNCDPNYGCNPDVVESIYKVDLRTGNYLQIPYSAEQYGGLCVEPISNKLFFSEQSPTLSVVRSMDIQTYVSEVLFTKTENIFDLQFNRLTNKFYYTTFLNSGIAIKSCDYYGGNEQLFEHQYFAPNIVSGTNSYARPTLALDIGTNMLYWNYSGSSQGRKVFRKSILGGAAELIASGTQLPQLQGFSGLLWGEIALLDYDIGGYSFETTIDFWLTDPLPEFGNRSNTSQIVSDAYVVLSAQEMFSNNSVVRAEIRTSNNDVIWRSLHPPYTKFSKAEGEVTKTIGSGSFTINPYFNDRNYWNSAYLRLYLNSYGMTQPSGHFQINSVNVNLSCLGDVPHGTLNSGSITTYILGTTPVSGSFDLFTEGRQPDSFDMYTWGHIYDSGNVTLYLQAHSGLTSTVPLYIGASGLTYSTTLYTFGTTDSGMSANIPLYITGPELSGLASGNFDMVIVGPSSVSPNTYMNLYTAGYYEQVKASISLYVCNSGQYLTAPLYTKGASLSIGNPLYPGDGYYPTSASMNLYMNRPNEVATIPLFIQNQVSSGYIDMYMLGASPVNSGIDLVIPNTVGSFNSNVKLITRGF